MAVLTSICIQIWRFLRLHRVDFFNMRRNLRIAGTMLCMTIAVHIFIYHKETVHQSRGTYNSSSASVAKGVRWRGHHHDNHSSAIETPNNTVTRGDGELYKEIQESSAPFVHGNPKQLIILGYQRVGSSFFGQIFDQNDDFFYVYEPLDAVYAEMYGTQGGMNVPSDITYWANGTQREVPQYEKDAVEKLLSDILGCHVADLPQGFLLHKYWYFLMDHFMPSWRPYKNCFKRNHILKAREDCATKYLLKVCPGRFNIDITKQEHCRQSLASAKAGDHNPFGEYLQCLDKRFKMAAPCITMYEQKCKHAKMWVTKTVRGTMDEMDHLLDINPNLRIIHLIRDPRPVVVSRTAEFSYRGIYSENITQKQAGDKVKESHIYCGTVLKDLKHRQLLEKQYPGRVVEVIYEDFVQNPEEYVKAIYKFLNESIPKSILSWIHKNTQGHNVKHNSLMRMKAWKSKLNFEDAEAILKECHELYEMLDYKWPYHEDLS